MTTVKRRLLAACAAALVAGIAIAAPAQASPAAPVAAAHAVSAPVADALPHAAPWSADRFGDLHIHYLTEPDGDLPGSSVIDSVTGKPNMSGLIPRAGAGFMVTAINGIDLTTDTGQATAIRLSAALADAKDTSTKAARATITGAGLTLGDSDARSGLTNTSGELSFYNLPAGLYLVEQTVVPAGLLAARPVVVTVPIPDLDHPGQWLTSVDIFPKAGVPVTVPPVITPTPTHTPTPTGGVSVHTGGQVLDTEPSTGVLVRVGFVFIGACGAALVVAGLRRRKDARPAETMPTFPGGDAS
jgi:hypothetical protein